MTRKQTNRRCGDLIEVLETRRLLSSTLDWQPAADAPLTRAEGSKAVVNGKLYIFGGFINDATLAVTKEADVFDPVTNQWSRLADMPVPETHGGTAVVGDDIWIAGFFYNDGVTASPLVYMYNTDSNVWTQEPSLPAGRGAVGMAAIGDTIHVWGGLTGQTTSANNHWALNTDNLAAGWQSLAPLPQKLDHVGGVTFDGELWSLGGFVNKEETDGNQSVVYSYDPTTDAWTTRTPLPMGLGHIGPDTTVAGDKIIIAGGQIDAAFEDEITNVIQYDPATGTSVQLTAIPEGRKSADVGYADGELIITCGNQNNSPFLSQKTWVAQYDAESGSVQLPTVTIANATAQAGNNESFSVTLSAASDTPITASYSPSAGSAPLTDFNSSAGTISIPAGSTSTTIDLATTTDSRNASETFTLALASLSANATFANGQSSESATGTITPAASPPITASPAGATISLSSSSAVLVAGQSDTFDLAVTGDDGGVPAGTVQLFEDATQMVSAPLDANGRAIITLPAPVVGGSWTAVYSGNANYSQATSNSVSQTNFAPSTVTASFGKTVIPASGISNEPFVARLPVTLANTGSALKGIFTLNVFADTAAVGLSGSPVLLSTTVHRLALRAGASTSMGLILKKLPANLPPGNYHIVVEMTAPNGRAQLITAGQFVDVEAPLSAISLSVGAPIVGKIDTLVLSIINTGNLLARGLAVCTVTVTQANGTPVVVHIQHIPVDLKPGVTGVYKLRMKVPAAAVGQPPTVTVRLGTLTASVTETTVL